MASDETVSASLVGVMLVVSDMLSASLVGVSLDELTSAGVPPQEESASIDNSKKAVCFFFKKKGFIYVPPKDIGFVIILLHHWSTAATRVININDIRMDPLKKKAQSR